MKYIFKPYIVKSAFFAAVLSVAIASCKKDSDGSPEVKAGNPTFAAITPSESPGGTTVTLTGSGLGQMRSIVFDRNNVPANFQTNLNTESAIVFRVPDTAFGGQQNIVLTNVDGKQLKVPFRVIALPLVSEASNYDFNANDEITLTGNNLDDVSKVAYVGSNTELTIVSKNRKSMVVRMAATTASRVKLEITNSSGKITTDQEFTYIPNAFAVYTDGWGSGPFGGAQDWSWGSTRSEATNIVKAGTKSYKVEYSNGALSIQMGMNWQDPNVTFAQVYTERQFLTFWAYAVDDDVKIRLAPDGPWSGPAATMWNAPPGSGGSETVTVPKNTWKYFKIPASTFKGLFSRMNFVIDGSTNKTVYFDNILWVK